MTELTGYDGSYPEKPHAPGAHRLLTARTGWDGAPGDCSYGYATLTVVVLLANSQPTLWEWFGPVLTFCGSALLFLGAMITLAVTNRREASNWRRATIMKLASDALGVGLAIQNDYLAAMDPERPDATQVMRGATMKSWQFFAIADNLRIVGAAELAEGCDKIRKAAGELNAPAKQCREALIKFAGETHKLPHDEPERTDALGDLFARRAAYEWTAWQVALTDYFLARSHFTESATAILTGTNRRWYFLWLH